MTTTVTKSSPATPLFPQIVLLGDSITQLSFDPELNGFGAKLAHVYQRRADVLNRGFSGYNTRWALEHLDTDVGAAHVFGGGDRVRLVTVFYGANDASDAVLNPRHHVPLPEYEANLRRLASRAREACPNARVVVVGPPPVHHESRLRYQIKRYGAERATGKLERTLESSRAYAAAAARAAKESRAPFVDLWTDMTTARPTDWHSFLSDGLHLSAEGNRFVGERLLDVIDKECAELRVAPSPHTGHWGSNFSQCDALEKFAPWHDEIDHENPSNAFN